MICLLAMNMAYTVRAGQDQFPGGTSSQSMTSMTSGDLHSVDVLAAAASFMKADGLSRASIRYSIISRALTVGKLRKIDLDLNLFEKIIHAIKIYRSTKC